MSKKQKRNLVKVRPKETCIESVKQIRQNLMSKPQSLKLKKFSTDFDGVVTYLSPVLSDVAGRYFVVKKTQGNGRIYVQLPSEQIISHYGLTQNQIRKLVQEVKDAHAPLTSIANRYNSTRLLGNEFVDNDWGKTE